VDVKRVPLADRSNHLAQQIDVAGKQIIAAPLQ